MGRYTLHPDKIDPKLIRGQWFLVQNNAVISGPYPDSFAAIKAKRSEEERHDKATRPAGWKEARS